MYARVIDPHTIDWCQLNEQPNKVRAFGPLHSLLLILFTACDLEEGRVERQVVQSGCEPVMPSLRLGSPCVA